MVADTSYRIEEAGDECDNPIWLIRGVCDIQDTSASSRNSEASVTWDEERHGFSLAYSIMTQPSSDGYVLEYERLDLKWRYKITETGSVELTTTWGENEALDEPDGQLQTGRSNRDYITALGTYRQTLRADDFHSRAFPAKMYIHRLFLFFFV